MPRTTLKNSAGAVASGLAIAQNDRLTVIAAGRDCTLELYTTGGGAVVAIQARNLAGEWQTLALDDGATSITLADGTPASVRITSPIETLGVLVSSVTGTPRITAAIVSREVY